MSERYIVATEIGEDSYVAALLEALMHGVLEGNFEAYVGCKSKTISIAFSNKGDATAFKLGTLEEKYKKLLEAHRKEIKSHTRSPWEMVHSSPYDSSSLRGDWNQIATPNRVGDSGNTRISRGKS